MCQRATVKWYSRETKSRPRRNTEATKLASELLDEAWEDSCCTETQRRISSRHQSDARLMEFHSIGRDAGALSFSVRNEATWNRWLIWELTKINSVTAVNACWNRRWANRSAAIRITLRSSTSFTLWRKKNLISSIRPFVVCLSIRK